MSLPRQYPIPDDIYHAPEETIYSVAEYISLLNVKLKPLKATIQGEIGKISYYPRAVYFSVFDKDRNVLNCMAWPGRLQSLGIELKDGLEVKIQGYPDVYPQTGRLTFKADVITPIGEGALKLAFERLKRELEAQGYFRQDRKQQLPQHIERIGLITSESGVVIRDFLTGLGTHGQKISFYDVRVEGLQAIENIVTAIQWFNEHTQDVQVVVIARGGGSLERMQPFNSLEVAKAIYSSKIPVMTAIGHEADITIADLVADVRASVPMDAGARLAESWVKAAERIETVEQSILSSFRSAFRTLDTQLTVYSDNFLSTYAKNLTQCRKQVDSAQGGFMRCFRDVLRRIQSIEANFSHNDERFTNRLTTESNALAAQDRVLHREAGHFFTRLATRLTALTGQFQNSHTRYRRFLRSVQNDIAAHEEEMQQEAKRWYVAIAKRITECENMLLACDPKLKLKQGFSIVKDKTGKVLKSSRTVAIDDIIHVELYDGILDSKVEDIR
jgi:exodeoxyribonuclease VII large subunit